jgi:hypothetical protein
MTSRYRHTITGYKSQIERQETGGGILADEMGMGKSLSILALIAKTIDEAREWAHTSNSGEQENDLGGRAVRRSRATLIVVSSACESYRSIGLPLANMCSTDKQLVERNQHVSYGNISEGQKLKSP